VKRPSLMPPGVRDDTSSYLRGHPAYVCRVEELQRPGETPAAPPGVPDHARVGYGVTEERPAVPGPDGEGPWVWVWHPTRRDWYLAELRAWRRYAKDPGWWAYVHTPAYHEQIIHEWRIRPVDDV
jgi:hypothetical protein